MPIIQKQVDKNKFHQSHPIYYVGQGRYKGGSLATPSSKLHPIYLHRPKEGGFFNLSSIVDTAKNIGEVINTNKDTIQSVASTIGSVADAGKAISETIKTSKELEKLKTVQEQRNKNKKKTKVELSPEQLERIKKVGNGFMKF
jgi:hypothetical protein